MPRPAKTWATEKKLAWLMDPSRRTKLKDPVTFLRTVYTAQRIVRMRSVGKYIRGTEPTLYISIKDIRLFAEQIRNKKKRRK